MALLRVSRANLTPDTNPDEANEFTKAITSDTFTL
jgi:hypothetical protein